MKHTTRCIFVAAVLVLAAIFVLPVSASRLPSAIVFQSPVDTPTPTLPPPATETPTVVPPATETPTVVPPATNTPTPTSTPIPPVPTATSYPVCTPPPCAFPGHLACTNPNGCPGGCGTVCIVPPPPPPPPPVYPILGYHTVKPGETLYCIGRGYQISPWAIASTNYIPWPYYVYVNQRLAIPNAPWYNIPAGPVCAPQFGPGPYPTFTPAPPTVTPNPLTPTPVPGACRYRHYVQWGQTLSGIAWYYGTTIQAVMYANPSITNPNLIYAGSTLCIP
jgi:LysM repeat protein